MDAFLKLKINSYDIRVTRSKLPEYENVYFYIEHRYAFILAIVLKFKVTRFSTFFSMPFLISIFWSQTGSLNLILF